MWQARKRCGGGTAVFKHPIGKLMGLRIIPLTYCVRSSKNIFRSDGFHDFCWIDSWRVFHKEQVAMKIVGCPDLIVQSMVHRDGG